jgi:hypothetical protein
LFLDRFLSNLYSGNKEENSITIWSLPQKHKQPIRTVIYLNEKENKMETNQFAKQTLNFQKTIFDNSFNAIALAQDQTETMFNGYVDNLPWVTDESKKSLQDSVDVAKKARDDFKKAVEDGFARFEELMEQK